jgi:arabinofuranosyltransferase
MTGSDRSRCWNAWSFLLGIALFAIGLFLFLSWRTYGFGFPLDDSWIHQTYARNLIRDGAWAFNRQESSSGSTAPLWTLLLSAGYLLGISNKVWSYGLGVALLGLTAWTAAIWHQRRCGEDGFWPYAVAGLILAEWHLVWAALSGMETVAAMFIILVVFLLMEKEHYPAWLLGVLIGVGVWIRPDAVTLALPLLWAWSFQRPWDVRRNGLRLLQALAGAILILIPYLLLNYTHSGSIWPSTYYAKQAEYAVLRELPAPQRLFSMTLLPLVGVGSVMLPGVLYSIIQDIRTRSWWGLAPIVWLGSFIVLYAVRLPVMYQHGRYLMPVIPVFLVLGMEGMRAWVSRGNTSRWRWVLARSWQTTTVLLSAIFLVRGGQVYARDVAIIETEMVAAARWVSERTPPDALVAAHDIGALGYYGERRILDLAGLVSPEVIPILRDEKALSRYLDARGADYLMTFPGWYPELVSHAEAVFQTHAMHSLAAGGENMTVYLWNP